MDFVSIFELLRPGENVSPACATAQDYQEIVDSWRGSGSAPSLAEVRAGDVTVRADSVRVEMRQRFVDEAMRRIQLQVADWSTMDEIKLLASIWNMLGTPSASQAAAKDIYVYVQSTALPWVTGATQAQLGSIVPENNDPLPGALAPWP